MDGRPWASAARTKAITRQAVAANARITAAPRKEETGSLGGRRSRRLADDDELEIRLW
jgi:hypothetical protein